MRVRAGWPAGVATRGNFKEFEAVDFYGAPGWQYCRRPILWKVEPMQGEEKPAPGVLDGRQGHGGQVRGFG